MTATSAAIAIRRADISDTDLEAISAIQNRVAPDEPTDPIELRWSAARYPGGARFIAETADGRAVATATVGRIWVQPPEYPAYWADIAVLPEARGHGIGTALLIACSDVSRADGKSILHIPASDARPEGVAFLEHRGFTELERYKSVRLDLVGLEPPEIEAPAGIRLTTLAAEPSLVAGVHAVAVETFPDIPGDDPMVPGDLDEFRGRDVDRPGIPPEAFMVAVDDRGAVVGYAGLILPPARPTVGFHDMTAVRRAARGRGVATALKRATIAWAIGAGLEALETGTDVANGPMRAVNAALGYRELPDLLTFQGPLFGRL